MNIYPIAMSTVNWPLFIKQCQEHFNYSPTKGLDVANIPIKDPAAYVACFNLENKPLESLRLFTNVAYHHFSISFLIDVKVPIELYTLGRVKHFEKTYRQHTLTILSGTIYDWLQTIEYTQHFDLEIRRILNEIVNILSSTWLKEIFATYERIFLPDKTFILKRK